ncbi:amino acid ABC transporter permease [Terribacillus saccharophilus]|uniref:Amino acid ABC transporter permease n=1 Tax=Terribacillus saccharophilus TaxID=361277 RepID=A0A268HA69_9BACI|nr:MULTISPECIES: ABC transporter permease [Terribacillus]PAD34631.1 amino acid ABC transporter permease [Terribacillus saccharophilus]PAD95379.1 amino acid ABC transporter permease [Terribacillus saccharophilus]PAD98957.1 amino acid ABC transporter permease [Terribacillus saccharophilus]PAE06775.1 amino acid ABC transporter permease [Terribacillus saccharophilus]VVM34002.1 Osmotically activated L-carnitine/choline ABC transporter2C permease protein OpuCD [Terribacillus sp. AE2B 122]
MDILKELMTYYSENGAYIWTEFYRHFLMSAYGVLFAGIVGIPVGILIARYSKLSPWVISFVNVIQTVPALALLAVLMLVMGLGTNTVILALFLYSLLPIIKNTYTGILGVDKTLKEAGNAMGMTRFQILRMVELPLSLSVIMAGLRTALVIAIGIATIGTFIGAGGLGSIIVRGTNAAEGGAIILAGAIPTALMAVMADLVMGWFEKLLSPANSRKLS